MKSTPSAKHGSSNPPAARTKSAPVTSNPGSRPGQAATEVDVAYIDGKAYPINKNETPHTTRSSPTLASRLLASLVVCATAIVAQAQLVFIPDVQMRDWLNGWIPGVVDGAGFMDTQHSGIAGFTNSILFVQWSPADLTGLEYLTGMDNLTIDVDTALVNSITIPAFPPNLTNLYMPGYTGTSLPAFPPNLRYFVMTEATQLTSLPPWPATIEQVQLHFMPDLLFVPAAPAALDHLELASLTSIADLTGALPDSIFGDLSITNMPLLANLPSLPAMQAVSGLSYLTLGQLPQVADLPTISNGVTYLSLYQLPLITALPNFPDSLIHFSATQLPLLECVPTLPLNTDFFYTDSTGVDCIPNIPPGLITTNLPLCGFYNAGNCLSFAPSVSGTVYHDVNANGARDAGEPGVAYATVDVTPSNTITGVVDDGFYAQALNAGTYTINASPNNPYVTSISPASHTATLVNVSDVDSLNDFGVVLQANVQDLVVHLMQITPARPGFSNMLRLTYGNQGTIDMGGSVSFTFDDDQDWNSSSPAPDLLAGHTATWNFTDLLIGEQGLIDISLHTDTAVLLGTTITHDATADPIATDETLADNVDTITSQVVGSFDPNDKSVSPSEMTSSQVASGERLTYTIRFQNTGTYQAERVIITDTLSTDLQWNTMNLIASSHPCNWFIHEGTLRFTFEPIVLPDSISDEPGSHGFVTFSMVPYATLTNGMQVANTANIYFDFNAPVVTNEALFSLSDPQGITTAAKAGPVLSPNPVHDVLWVGPLSDGSSTLTVLDATGRTVMTTLVTGPSMLLDVSALLPGAYHIRLDEEGVVRHFVKY